MVGISAPVQQSNVENSFHTLFSLFTLFASQDRLSHCFILNENLSLDTNVTIILIVTIVLFCADLVLLRSFSGMFIKTKYSNVLGKPVERIEGVGREGKMVEVGGWERLDHLPCLPIVSHR